MSIFGENKKNICPIKMGFSLGICYAIIQDVSQKLDAFGKTLADEKREQLDEIEKILDDARRTVSLDNFMEDIYEE